LTAAEAAKLWQEKMGGAQLFVKKTFHNWNLTMKWPLHSPFYLLDKIKERNF
jgi:hypothetical protein